MAKIIVQNTTNRVKYILANNQTVVERSNGRWSVSKPRSSKVKFGIGDMGPDNSQVIENVRNVPNGAIGDQYNYSSGRWTEVDGWVNPATQVNIPPLL
jgi:hypothetical protein